MSGIVTIGIGSTGCQINRAFNDQIASEHGVDNISGSSFDEVGEYEIERRSLYLNEEPSNKYSSRAIYFDTDKEKLEQATQMGGNFIDLKHCHSASSSYDADNFGLFGDASKIKNHTNMISGVQESIRRKIEQCDALRGVRIFASSAGGTGSGATQALLEHESSSDWNDKSYLFSVASDVKNGISSPDHWNSVYNTLSLVSSTSNICRGIVWYDWNAALAQANNNSSISSMCQPNLPVVMYPTKSNLVEMKQVPSYSNLTSFDRLENLLMEKLQPGLEQLLKFEHQRIRIDEYFLNAKKAIIRQIESELNSEDTESLGDSKSYTSGNSSGTSRSISSTSDSESDEEEGDELEREIKEKETVAMKEARSKYLHEIMKYSEIDTEWDKDAEMKLVLSDYDCGIQTPVQWLGKYLKASQNQNKIASQRKDKNNFNIKAEELMTVSNVVAFHVSNLTSIERFHSSRYSSLDVVHRMQPYATYKLLVPGMMTWDNVTSLSKAITLDSLCMSTSSQLSHIEPATGKYASYLGVFRERQSTALSNHDHHDGYLSTNDLLSKPFGYNASKECFLPWSPASMRTESTVFPSTFYKSKLSSNHKEQGRDSDSSMTSGRGVYISTIGVTSAMDKRLESMCQIFTQDMNKGIRYCLNTAGSGPDPDRETSLKYLTENIKSNYLSSKMI